MATLLSICTQKGGAGKTTLTMHLATHYHVVEGRPVVVIDADYPQHSFHHQRQAELRRLETEAALLESLQRQGRVPYEVWKADLTRVPELVAQIEQRSPGALVFIDLPGTLNVRGYAGVIELLDGVILPMEADRLTFSSGLMTLEVLSHLPGKRGGMVPTRLVWNRYKLNERASRYTELETAIDEFCRREGFQAPFLTTRIRDRVGWKDHRSALFPYADIRPLAEEINQVFLTTTPLA